MTTFDFFPFEQFGFGSEINEHGNNQLHFLHNNDYSDISVDSEDLEYAPQSTFSFETSNETHLKVPKNDLQWQSVVRKNNSRNLFSENVGSIQRYIHSAIHNATPESGYQSSTPLTTTNNVEFLPEERWQNVDTSFLSDISYQPISPLEDGTGINHDSSSIEEQNKIILDLDEVFSNMASECVEKIEEELKKSGNEVDSNGTSILEFEQLPGWMYSSVENGTGDSTSKNLVELELSQKGASTTAGTKKRKTFSKYQLTELETHFSLNPYPSKEEIENLGAVMEVSKKRLRIWFQNKRQRVSRRKKLLEKIYNN
nr:homeobox protein Hox-C11a-like [Leptinotarsa decemlineata]